MGVLEVIVKKLKDKGLKDLAKELGDWGETVFDGITELFAFIEENNDTEKIRDKLIEIEDKIKE